jgi:HD-like signal output (HDOD) protein/two-component sensor histidine kinase
MAMAIARPSDRKAAKRMSYNGATSMHELPDPLARAIESAKVPTLPQALLRLIRLTDDDATTMTELAQAVEQDPGLCARILTAANSPGLRRGTELRSVAHCLTSLGTRLIRSIATCIAMQSVFDRRYDSIKPDLADYWRHSIRVAEGARELAVVTGYANVDEAYLAGLLHDVGELLLLSAHGGTYAQMLSGAVDESGLAMIETERLGVHHGEVGAWLVDRWKFDFAIGDGILFHHASADEIATADPLPQIVWLAHEISMVRKVDERLVKISAGMFGDAVAKQIALVAQHAVERTTQIANAIGVASGDDDDPMATLPRVAVTSPRPPESDPENEIDGIVRDMALMQPLQRDLFGIESDVELLLSLRESARILFDLSHIAIFLLEPEGDRLSAARFGEQPALFRRAAIRIEATRCLVATAAATGRPVSSFDPDYAQPASLIDLQFARVFGTEGMLCVPMSGRAGPAGVLVFGLSAGQFGRLKRRLPWIQNFGRIAALSLEAWHEAIRYRKRADEDASARFERQARRVVHEAGNPLGIIRSYLKILDGKLPDGAAVREELGVLREEIDRVTSIVRRLSEIPRESAGRDGLNVAPLVRDLLAFYDAPLFRARGVSANLTLDETPSPVSCDSDTLKQILVNLWKNASEALPRGGKVNVTVTDGVVQNGRRHVEVRVADDGPGIAADALAKMSQDALPASGNRGMGLAIVGTLTRQIGATITCRSRPGAGTEFILLLPCRA